MVFTYLETVILYHIKKFNGERSIYAVYHMLKGKKSSQTIQDAHLFGLSSFFALAPEISRETIENAVQALEKNEFLCLTSEKGTAVITDKGNEKLKHLMDEYPLPPELNGLRYRDITGPFWERLSLLIQSLSHIIHRVASFYPIQRDTRVQAWVKGFLASSGKGRGELAEQFYIELSDFLEKRQPLEQTVFVSKLTGINRIGSTFSQLSRDLGCDEQYIRCVFLGTLDAMIQEAEAGIRLPNVAAAAADLLRKKGGDLMQSTKITLDLLKQNKNIDEAASIRRLKRNTIEDHVVEIAHTIPGFSIDPYVPEALQEKIIEAARMCGTKQLKVIKQVFHSEAEPTYFQIRLVLSKTGGAS